MTKTEIAKRLDALAIEMRSVALDMEYYTGFSPWSKHAKEMIGASFIAEEWAVEIRKEAENDNNILPPESTAWKRRSKTQKQKSKDSKTSIKG